MKYRELLNWATKEMVENGREESAALYLLEYTSGMTSPELYANLDSTVTEETEKKLKEYVRLHIKENKPVQYIIGEAPFFGYDFYVNENVLIPRFETEELVENVLFKYDEYFKGKKVDVCDVATGSGCIGITLSLEEPNMNVSISDISFEALEVAKRNCEKLGANVVIKQGDMLEPFYGEKFDILVSNPPYIPEGEDVMSLVKDNEPNIALFGGSDGLKFYNVILSNASKILKEKALILFEHGFDKGREMMEMAKFYFPESKVEVLKDMEGKDRMTIIAIGFKNE